MHVLEFSYEIQYSTWIHLCLEVLLWYNFIRFVKIYFGKMFLNVNESADDVHIIKVHDGDSILYGRQSEDTISSGDPTTAEIFEGFVVVKYWMIY